MNARVSATVVVVLMWGCGDDRDRDDDPLVCTEQADGTCAAEAPAGCWTWTAARVREGEGCSEATFATCTSGGLDAGAAITCWEVSHEDGTMARYVTGETSHRFPAAWSATPIDDAECDAAWTTACDP